MGLGEGSLVGGHHNQRGQSELKTGRVGTGERGSRGEEEQGRGEAGQRERTHEGSGRGGKRTREDE